MSDVIELRSGLASACLVVAILAPSTGRAQPAPPPTVRMLAAGYDFTCALIADGTVRCWGEGRFGERRTGGRQIPDWRPRAIDGLTGVAAIVASQRHVCARLESGAARCWGDNDLGQLGDGTERGSAVAVVVRDLRDVVDIAVGDAHSCAVLRDGTVRCWGSNLEGQIGAGAPWGRSPTRTTPTSEGDMRLPERATRPTIVPGIRRAARVRIDGSRTCIEEMPRARHPGIVRCWGVFEEGAETRRRPPTVPRVVPELSMPAVDRGGYQCEITSSSGVVCSGRPFSNTSVASEVPPPVIRAPIPSLRDTVQVVVGPLHACALDRRGRVRCWGHNSRGQLADGSVSIRATPTRVLGLTRVSEIAVGDSHVCARRVDGTVWCWGDNSMRQAGSGSRGDRIVPAPIAISGVAQIAAGGAHTCARMADGTARCWGLNRHGQLGDGTTVDRDRPVEVAGLRDVVQIGCGGEHTCARGADGTMVCWGHNDRAQLGDGTHRDRRGPVVLRDRRDVVDVSLGPLETCARTRDGRASCWGFSSPFTAPIEAAAIGVGSVYACALERGGALRCYDGGDGGRWTAAPIATVRGATRLAVGARHACVLAEGRVHCIGGGAWGVLGDGTFADRSVLQPVPGLDGVTDIAAGGAQTCAIRRDATVVCWGANDASQLGDGSASFRATPVDVVW